MVSYLQMALVPGIASERSRARRLRRGFDCKHHAALVGERADEDDEAGRRRGHP